MNKIEIKIQGKAITGFHTLYKFTCEQQHLNKILIDLFNFSSFIASNIELKLQNNETFEYETKSIGLKDYKKITIKSI